MPCIIALLALAFPRVVFAVLWFFTNFFRSIDSILALILGFLLVPLTTMVYAWLENTGRPVDWLYLTAIVVALLFDLGLIGQGEHRRRTRSSA